MKTREQAEKKALELYPKTHIATVNQLHEVSRQAFLKGVEYSFGFIDQSQYKIGYDPFGDPKIVFPKIKPATELTNEKHSESLDTKENEGSELPSEKQKDKQKRNPSLIDFRNWLTANDNGHRSASLMVAEFIYQNSKP